MSRPRSRDSSIDSLFSERTDEDNTRIHLILTSSSPTSSPDASISGSTIHDASRLAPSIPGLWIFPSVLPNDIARNTVNALGNVDVFSGGSRDQVMLFEAPKHLSANSSLPAYIHKLLNDVRELLQPYITVETARTLFDQPLARQVILNLYPPGEGITPHIDLPNRYADGIIGCSLIGGCVMTFQKGEERHDVYLPPRTVYILSGESRWEWTHGIEGREHDVVEREGGQGRETILRDLRVSVTFRWMKEGADILS
ncbi:hypothetical protein IAU59_005121 [Kwoniella sp. CBS 9459]